MASRFADPQARHAASVRMVTSYPARSRAKIGGTDGLKPDDMLDAGFAWI